MATVDPSLEPRFTPPQIARMWKGVSAKKVRSMFENEPGVMRTGRAISSPRGKRKKVHVWIPLSVVQRVHTRLTEAGMLR